MDALPIQYPKKRFASGIKFWKGHVQPKSTSKKYWLSLDDQGIGIVLKYIIIINHYRHKERQTEMLHATPPRMSSVNKTLQTPAEAANQN